MKMVVIFGPAAVGKMAVGQALSAVTKFPLLHNHVTIEPLLRLFPYSSSSFKRLNKLFRQEIIAELAASNHPGMVFTYIWDLVRQSDQRYIEELIAKFTPDLRKVCFVELFADQATRLERNKTSLRLAEKPSKRNSAWSHADLIAMDRDYVLNTSSERPFFYPDQHLKIDNSNLRPEEVAARIVEHFQLVQIGS